MFLNRFLAHSLSLSTIFHGYANSVSACMCVWIENRTGFPSCPLFPFCFILRLSQLNVENGSVRLARSVVLLECGCRRLAAAAVSGKSGSLPLPPMPPRQHHIEETYISALIKPTVIPIFRSFYYTFFFSSSSSFSI